MKRIFGYRAPVFGLAVLAAILMSPANADVLTEVSNCRNLTDSLARLVCYDAIAIEQPEAPEAPPAPPMVDETPAATPAPVAPVTTAPAAADTDDEFGKEIIDARSGPKSIESRIISEFSGWRKGEVFELENGQQWVQTDPQEFRIRDAATPLATIKRKAFGSYRMSIEGSNRSVRVRRIR